MPPEERNIMKWPGSRADLGPSPNPIQVRNRVDVGQVNLELTERPLEFQSFAEEVEPQDGNRSQLPPTSRRVYPCT